MLMFCDQNAGHQRNTKISHRISENVARFKYLSSTITNQNLMHEEIKNRLNSANTCYHSVQNPLPSRLLPKNVKIKIFQL
jgi:hypothetical protein